MTSKDEHRPSLANAAGRVAFFPARAAARAWRGPIEEAVEEFLSSPEIARVVDRALAGSLPEELARSLVRNRVLERVAADEFLSSPEIADVVDRALAGSLPEELARSLVRNRVLERVAAELTASGELQRLVAAALASPKTLELTDRVLASDETQRALRHVASSPELRDAIARQTTGLTEELVRGVRASAARLDDRAERVVRRPPRAERPIHGGIATRAIALAVDAAVTIVLFTSAVGMAALVASLVGGLRPAWLVGVLLAFGWMFVAGTYFVLFWSAAGQTPGMRLLGLRLRGPRGGNPSVGRSLVRSVGLALAIVPFFAGFVPVLFTERRRALPDLLAGTVVVYDGPRAV